MALTFAEIKTEVKRRATKDQGGGTFDTAISTVINTSLIRIAREAPWRSMRRATTFLTVAPLKNVGVVTVTNGSAVLTDSGATFITNNVEIGRYIKVAGSSVYFRIAQVNSETQLTLSLPYLGVSASSTSVTYHIYGQETYNLPAQVGIKFFLWHERYGFPLKLRYSLEQDFYRFNTYVYIENVPQLYHMWGEDMIITQLKSPSAITVSSSVSSDISMTVTVMGIVNGYPDSEVLNVTGTTPYTGLKTFSSVERVVKSGATSGLITVTANSSTTKVAVIPVGNITAGIQYKKVKIWPLPTDQFTMYCHYYKDPYKLVNDGDVHELGHEFDEALILLSTAKIKADTNQNENETFLAYYKDEIANLKKTNMDKIDWMPTLERPFMDSRQPFKGLSYLQIPGGWAGPQTLV